MRSPLCELHGYAAYYRSARDEFLQATATLGLATGTYRTERTANVARVTTYCRALGALSA